MSALLNALHRLEQSRPMRRSQAETQTPSYSPSTIAPADKLVDDEFVDEVVPQGVELRRNALPLVEPRHVDELRAALDQIDWPTPAAMVVAPFAATLPEPELPQPLAWGEVALPNPVLPREMHEAAAELVRLVPRPALAAAVAVGMSGELLPTLRSFGEAISAQTKADVVLLGPGSLIDSEQLSAQWSALRAHVGYGIVHTTAERALERINTLQQTAGVIAVAKLGTTTTRSIVRLREQLAAQNVPFLGLLVVRDE